MRNSSLIYMQSIRLIGDDKIIQKFFQMNEKNKCRGKNIIYKHIKYLGARGSFCFQCIFMKEWKRIEIRKGKITRDN